MVPTEVKSGEVSTMVSSKNKLNEVSHAAITKMYSHCHAWSGIAFVSKPGTSFKRKKRGHTSTNVMTPINPRNRWLFAIGTGSFESVTYL